MNRNKKTLRLVLIVALAAVMLMMFAACGSKATRADFNELVDKVGSADIGEVLGIDGLPDGAATGSDKPSTASSAVAGDDSLEKQLLGNWSEVDIDNTYTFNADGTGIETYEGETWDMTWSLNGDVLTMDFPATGVEEYSITIRGNKLTVHNPVVAYDYIRQ